MKGDLIERYQRRVIAVGAAREGAFYHPLFKLMMASSNRHGIYYAYDATKYEQYLYQLELAQQEEDNERLTYRDVIRSTNNAYGNITRDIIEVNKELTYIRGPT